MISPKERTKILFRNGLAKALRPMRGMEVTRAFFTEIAQAIKANPHGCILRCQSQEQKDAANRYLAKHLRKDRLQFFPVKLKDEE